MLFTTLPQLIVLAILFFGGLMLGLGLHPGGKKWRNRFEEESDSYAEFRRDADLNMREANRRIADLEREQADLQDREAKARRAMTDAETRLAEANYNARSTTPGSVMDTGPTPVTTEPAPTATGFAMPLAAVATAPEAKAEPVPETKPVPAWWPEHDTANAPAVETAVAEAEPEAPAKSWFSMGGTPDLGRLRGIDPALKTSLFGLGVTNYEDIISLSAEDEMALEQRLSLPAGYITREQWRDQAALLRAGKTDEHAERFG